MCFRSSIIKLSPRALVCKLTLILLESLKSVHGSSEHRSGSTSSKLELIPSWKIQLLIVHTVSVVTGDQARQKSLQDLAESVFGFLFIYLLLGAFSDNFVQL